MSEQIHPAPAPDAGRRLYDIPGAAAYLVSLGADGVSQWTVRRLISEHKLKHLKLGHKIFVSRSALDDLIARLEVRSK